MEAYRLREKLLREITDADEVLLKIVEDAIETYHHTRLPIASEPMSIEQYNRELDISLEQIKSNDVFTEEEVDEIIKRWGKR
ncbi:hypothetical protein OGH69_03935 [Flavobacterium sp. MFBS3-15]|uniref:hypothetical protein n=1 Tax=Flavobacterium sp. MFBS3-15 TaxID=2989816 RepID=UPI0022355A5F|nr:hypothetical protein [Flavobacterium sp. MFBS3-15]MCW4468105.1 hypothetical protein [Flavobacterium sp. MFBS3-15]